MNVTKGATYYLPMHEYFHQVEYQYFNGWDTSSEPYWWMEATAEWAAHRAQETPGFPGRSESTYATSLEQFLSSASGLHVAQSALLSPRGAEYGAFVLPEYLAERFGGDEAIRWIWDRIGDGTFGIRPLDAVDDYVQMQWSSYPEAIQDFRLWNYVLAQNGDIGFTNADAAPGGFWRDNLTHGDLFRRVTARAVIDPVAGSASGSASAAASNSAYIEIEKPAGVGGTAEFSVSRRAGLHGSSSLSNVRASVIPIAQYPTQCSGIDELIVPHDDGGTVSRVSAAGGTSASAHSTRGNNVMRGTSEIPAACSTITLVITNTSKTSETMNYDWSVTFTTTSGVLSNGVVELGVTRAGVIGADGLGVRRTGNAGIGVVPVSAWGISDGTYSGCVSRDTMIPEGNLGLSNFAVTGQTSIVDSTLTGYSGSHRLSNLDVRLTYRPSDSPSVYAIDVRVRRDYRNRGSGRVLFKMGVDFDIPPITGYERLTWNAGTGEVPAFVDSLTHGNENSWVHPLVDRGAAVALGVTYGPADEGTSIGLDLGDLAIGEQATFTLYVGVATSSGSATAAVNALDPALYAFAEPGEGSGVPGAIGILGVSDVNHAPATSGPGPV